MAGKVFLDTKLLIYAFSAAHAKQRVALDLLLSGGVIGIQTLNEFVNVALGEKMRTPWAETMQWVETICELCPAPVPVTMSVHRRGLRIACELRYSIYDSLLLAAAIESSCSVFYSEDLRDGQLVDRLLIRNPFKATL